MARMYKPPVAPEDCSSVCLIYDFRPSGATFDPPATLNICYDPSDIPEGVSEENLVIGRWDADANEWVKLDSTVDTESHTITAKVSQFSAFTILAYIRPAAFTTSDLIVSPAEVDIKETVNIGLLVTNTGDLTGSYEVTLKIDNVEVATKDVTLAGGDSETVTFTTAKDVAATYSVTVDGLSDTFTVKPSLAPAPMPPPEEKAEVALLEEEEGVPAAPVPAKPINWPLIGGISTVVVILSLVSYFFVRKRREA